MTKCRRAVGLNLLTVVVFTTGWLVIGCEPSPAVSPDPVAPTATTTTPPTPSSSSGSSSSANATILFVSDKIVDCEGEGPMKCMQTRASETEEWSLFYGSIEGFTHDPKFTYELRVSVAKAAKPPAGGSSLKYKLIEVVSKKPAK